MQGFPEQGTGLAHHTAAGLVAQVLALRDRDLIRARYEVFYERAHVAPSSCPSLACSALRDALRRERLAVCVVAPLVPLRWHSGSEGDSDSEIHELDDETDESQEAYKAALRDYERSWTRARRLLSTLPEQATDVELEAHGSILGTLLGVLPALPRLERLALFALPGPRWNMDAVMRAAARRFGDTLLHLTFDKLGMYVTCMTWRASRTWTTGSWSRRWSSNSTLSTGRHVPGGLRDHPPDRLPKGSLLHCRS